MNTQTDYVGVVEECFAAIRVNDTERIIGCFCHGAEPDFVKAIVKEIHRFKTHYHIQNGFDGSSAIVVVLLSSKNYALCEFELHREDDGWRILNVILRPLMEGEPLLFLGELFVVATV